MGLNKRARKQLDPRLPAGEDLVAIVQLITNNRVRHSTQTGNMIGSSVLGRQYFVDRALNLNHQGCLHLFHDAWMGVTNSRLVFFKNNAMALRPKPGDQIGEAALGSSQLNWWDQDKTWRVLHIEFDNGTWIGQATRRDEEADLVVQSWAARATQIAEP